MSAGLVQRPCWIFDLDGTLTIAAHDFDAIRAELGLPTGRPILEALAALPAVEAAPLWKRLDELELELAACARAAPGAAELLRALSRRGTRLGILTRNSAGNTRVTLEAAGLDRFFHSADVIAREHAPPKPRPDGIQRLLARWNAQPEHALIVGDYRFDLEAGRAAGIATVYFDCDASHEFAEHADLHVTHLDQLTRAL
jgi:HAD superfamily hydrolase (TIGR01509 family)